MMGDTQTMVKDEAVQKKKISIIRNSSAIQIMKSED
jgi:hypothetical protein